jgi:hypothetical protein
LPLYGRLAMIALTRAGPTPWTVPRSYPRRWLPTVAISTATQSEQQLASQEACSKPLLPNIVLPTSHLSIIIVL